MQKTKSADRKRELQSELTRVQQQMREEEARRHRQALDAERKVCTLSTLLCSTSVTDTLVRVGPMIQLKRMTCETLTFYKSTAIRPRCVRLANGDVQAGHHGHHTAVRTQWCCMPADTMRLGGMLCRSRRRRR